MFLKFQSLGTVSPLQGSACVNPSAGLYKIFFSSLYALSWLYMIFPHYVFKMQYKQTLLNLYIVHMESLWDRSLTRSQIWAPE